MLSPLGSPPHPGTVARVWANKQNQKKKKKWRKVCTPNEVARVRVCLSVFLK